MTDAKPDDNNPMDPANLSLANRVKFGALAIAVAPFLIAWRAASWASGKISHGFADLGPDAPDN